MEEKMQDQGNLSEAMRRRVEAEEDAVIDFQFLLLDLIREKGITQEELAERVGVSKARISQLFASGANPTFKNAARIFDAIGCRLRVSCEWEERAKPEVMGNIDRFLHIGHFTVEHSTEYESHLHGHSNEAANENYASLERAAA